MICIISIENFTVFYHYNIVFLHQFYSPYSRFHTDARKIGQLLPRKRYFKRKRFLLFLIVLEVAHDPDKPVCRVLRRIFLKHDILIIQKIGHGKTYIPVKFRIDIQHAEKIFLAQTHHGTMG